MTQIVQTDDGLLRLSTEEAGIYLSAVGRVEKAEIELEKTKRECPYGGSEFNYSLNRLLVTKANLRYLDDMLTWMEV